ncbi:MAG: hypothetical protein CM15mV133_280 [uncultured marine virus]|nr:MAG: hypothetical protein CM15mV133_280 [uncultured marine virus]
MLNKAETRLQELDEAHSEAQRVKAENVIRKTHEDFDDLRQSDKFHNWADDQPSGLRGALYENMDDPASVIRVGRSIKIDNGMTVAAKRNLRKLQHLLLKRNSYFYRRRRFTRTNKRV